MLPFTPARSRRAGSSVSRRVRRGWRRLNTDEERCRAADVERAKTIQTVRRPRNIPPHREHYWHESVQESDVQSVGRLAPSQDQTYFLKTRTGEHRCPANRTTPPASCPPWSKRMPRIPPILTLLTSLVSAFREFGLDCSYRRERSIRDQPRPIGAWI